MEIYLLEMFARMNKSWSDLNDLEWMTCLLHNDVYKLIYKRESLNKAK